MQLLKEHDLTLDPVIFIGKQSDRNNIKPLNKVSDSKEEVHHFDKGESFFEEDWKPGIQNCGGSHAAKQKTCPAFGKKRLYCGETNHFEKVCRS